MPTVECPRRSCATFGWTAQIACLCEDMDELMGKTVRLQGAPVLSGYKIGLIGDPDAYFQKLFGLLGAASPQLLDHWDGRATVLDLPLFVSFVEGLSSSVPCSPQLKAARE
jgi:hypothetical protein